MIKRKNLLKSLLICIDFNATFKKFSRGDSPGAPSKDPNLAIVTPHQIFQRHIAKMGLAKRD